MAIVLIVDDDLDVIESFTDLLHSQGHEVRTGRGGEEGLRMLRGAPLPDVVLLDVDMPKMSGPQMADQMRVNAAGQETIPIILFSARRDLHEIAQRMGTPYFITKAGDLDHFTRTLDRALRERIAPSWPENR